MGTKSVYPTFCAAPSTTAGTQYIWPVVGNTSNGWTSTIANVETPMPIAGGCTIDYLLIDADNSMGSKYVITLYVNGVATALTATPSGISGGDTTHSVTLNQGDLFNWACQTLSGASSTGNLRIHFRITANSANQSAIFGSSVSTGNYGPLQGVSSYASSGAVITSVMPVAGYIKNMYLALSATNNSASGTWKVGQNGGSYSYASYSGTGTTFNSTNSNHYAVGDTLYGWRSNSSGSYSGISNYGFEFDPDTDGYSISLSAIGSTATNNPATEYKSTGGNGTISTSLAPITSVIMGGVSIKNLYGGAGSALSSGDSIVGTMFQNGAAAGRPGSLSVALTSANQHAQDATDSITTSDYDLIGIQQVISGGIGGPYTTWYGTAFYVSPTTNYSFALGSGSFSLSGGNLSETLAISAPLATGAFALSGGSLSERLALSMPLTTGAFALSGGSAVMNILTAALMRQIVGSLCISQQVSVGF